MCKKIAKNSATLPRMFPSYIAKDSPRYAISATSMLVSLTNVIYHKSNKYTYIFNMEMKCTIFCTLYRFHRPIVLPT